MKTRCKKALILSAPAPNYLSTITVSTAKIISAMLRDGWDVDVIGFKEKGMSKPDDMFSSLTNGARLFLSAGLFNKPSTWTMYAVNDGKKLIDNNHYNLMISFAHYTWTHAAAFCLKKKYNIPWITFFSDPWGNNPDLGMHFLRRYMEYRVLHSCDAIAYSNSQLKDWSLMQFLSCRKLFEQKSFIIPYFYDDSLFPSNRIHFQNDKMIFRHMGQVPIGGYVLNLLRGLKMLIDEDMSLKDKIIFEFYGRVNPSYNGSVEKLVTELDLKKNVSFSSENNKVIHMPYNESLNLMTESSALLLLGIHPSFYNGWGNTVLHVKLIDYIGANKPIFALAGEGSVTQQLLGDTNGFCYNDDPVVIREALKRFIANPQIAANRIREQFSVDNVYPLWQEVFERVAF